MLHIHSHFLQEQEDPSKEVTKGLVIDQLLLNCLADLHPLRLFHVLLMIRTVEWQFDMSYILELGVVLVLRVDEVLNLCHLELPHSD